RELTKFLDFETQRDNVYTNFEDALQNEDASQYEIIKSDPKLLDYRVRVRRFIRDHQDHITIRRLRSNQPVSRKDLQALEEILFAEGGPIPREEYEKAFGSKPLGLLVRSIVGLDRKAAKEAFAQFLDKAPLTPDQISFLNDIVEHLVKNGTLEPKEM